MTGLQYALTRIHHGENELSEQLLRLGERHHAEHEVHHVSRDLATWSQEHVRLIADHASAFDLQLEPKAGTPSRATHTVRELASTAIGRRPSAGLMLLEDLAELYLQAAENSLAWEMLAQVAQAKHERDLLGLSEQCHPQTLRQMRWANTMIKTQTPQILAVF